MIKKLNDPNPEIIAEAMASICLSYACSTENPEKTIEEILTYLEKGADEVEN